VAEANAPHAWYQDGWAWTATGIGVAGLTVGGGYLLAASAKRDELDTASEFEKEDIRATADERERIGVVSLVGGGILAAVGVGLFVYNPTPQGRARVRASIGAGSFSLGVQVSF
jgi:hypothetical protein